MNPEPIEEYPPTLDEAMWMLMGERAPDALERYRRSVIRAARLFGRAVLRGDVERGEASGDGS